MKKGHWLKLLLGIGIILAIVAGCGKDSNNDSVTPDTDNGKTRSYLFVQNAASGTFAGDGDGNYTLTLNGVSPQTHLFL